MSQEIEAYCVSNCEEKPQIRMNGQFTLMEILCNDSPLISGRTTPAYLSLIKAKINENRPDLDHSPQRDSPAQTARNIQRIPDTNSDTRLLR